MSESVSGTIGAGGGTGEADVELAGTLGRDSDIGIGDVESRFADAEFEVYSAAGDLDSGQDMERGVAGAEMLDELDYIPEAVGGFNDVDVWVGEMQSGNLQLAEEELVKSYARLQGVGVSEWLETVTRVFMDGDVLEGETGAGEQGEVNGGEIDLTAEGRFDRLLDGRAKCGHAYERQNETQQRDGNNSDEENAENAAEH